MACIVARRVGPVTHPGTVGAPARRRRRCPAGSATPARDGSRRSVAVTWWSSRHTTSSPTTGRQIGASGQKAGLRSRVSTFGETGPPRSERSPSLTVPAERHRHHAVGPGRPSLVRQSAGSKVSGITSPVHEQRVGDRPRRVSRSVACDACERHPVAATARSPSRRRTTSPHSSSSSRGRAITTTTSGSSAGSTSSYQPTRASSQLSWPSSDELGVVEALLPHAARDDVEREREVVLLGQGARTSAPATAPGCRRPAARAGRSPRRRAVLGVVGRAPAGVAVVGDHRLPVDVVRQRHAALGGRRRPVARPPAVSAGPAVELQEAAGTTVTATQGADRDPDHGRRPAQPVEERRGPDRHLEHLVRQRRRGRC